jgi:tight adherence protein C
MLETTPFLIMLSRSLILLVVFLGVMAAALAGASLVTARISVRRRLDDQLGPVATEAGQSLRHQDNETGWIRMVNLIERRGVSLVDTNDERLRVKLIAAGYEGAFAPRLFTLSRMMLTLGLPAAYVGLAYYSGELPPPLKLYMFGSALALVGLYFPNLWIAARADRRRREIVNGFPDALDLMLVCVEAGLGLEAAFSRVGTEMIRSHPLVARMLGTVVLELRAGRSREDALRRMADRVQLEEIRSFATLLIQSSKLGSSIAQTLRIYASEMREQRRMRAEEKAHRLPVLISIPLVACMLPVMIGLLMLPALIRVVREILPVMGGG